MVEAEPLVSVIIPTRNRPALLDRCLRYLGEAIADVDHLVEVIVVDDGSSPPVEVPDYSMVRVVQGNGEGPAVARDRGICAATGSIVAFTDDDAMVDRAWLAAAIDALSSDPLAVGVRGPVVSTPYDPLYEHSVADDNGGRFLTCNVAYRRSDLLDEGGFDPGFRYAHEDIDLGLRMSKRGRMAFAPQMRVTHPGREFRPAEWDRRARFLFDDWLAFRRHPVLLGDRGPVSTAPFRIAARAWLRLALRSEPSVVTSPRRAGRWLRLATGQLSRMAWLTLTRRKGHLARPSAPRSGLRVDGLRIAYVGPVPSRVLGGAPGVEGALIEQLAAKGCSIDCYVPTSDHFNSTDDISSIEGVRVIEGRSSFEFGRWYSNNPLAKMVSFQLFQAMSRRRLASVLAAEHEVDPYDVIYQCSSIESFGVPKIEGLPIVLHPSVHAAGELRWLGVEADLARQCQGVLRPVLVRAWMAVRARRQRHDIQRVDAVLALSDVFGRLLVDDYGVDPSAIHVVPNCIDVEHFTINPPSSSVDDGPAVILVLGRVVVRKGIEDVVALSRRLVDLAGQVEIVIVGAGSLWSDYRPLLGDLEPRVARVAGSMDRQAVASMLASSRLLLQLSRYEPFGLTVAEALSAGVPVIATPAVGAAEGLADDVVELVEPGNIDQLEAAVRYAISAGPLDHDRRERCRSEAVRRYSPPVVAAELLTQLEAAATQVR